MSWEREIGSTPRNNPQPDERLSRMLINEESRDLIAIYRPDIFIADAEFNRGVDECFAAESSLGGDGPRELR